MMCYLFLHIDYVQNQWIILLQLVKYIICIEYTQLHIPVLIYLLCRWQILHTTWTRICLIDTCTIFIFMDRVNLLRSFHGGTAKAQWVTSFWHWKTWILPTSAVGHLALEMDGKITFCDSLWFSGYLLWTWSFQELHSYTQAKPNF